MWRTTCINNDQRGFTLLELLIASALLIPLVITLLLLVEAMQKAYSKGEARADGQQSARMAMARMIRELRAAGLDPGAVITRLPVPAVIQTAEVSRVAFIADPDGDGVSKKIEYRLDLSVDPPVLRRQQWSTWNSGWSGTNGAQPFAEGITALELTYYGADGTAIPSGELPARVGEIQRIGLVIIASLRQSQTSLEIYRLGCEVRMRNVGL